MINYQRIEEEFLLIFEGWARFHFEWDLDIGISHRCHSLCEEMGPPMAAEQLYAEWREWT